MLERPLIYLVPAAAAALYCAVCLETAPGLHLSLLLLFFHPVNQVFHPRHGHVPAPASAFDIIRRSLAKERDLFPDRKGKRIFFIF